MTVNSVIKEVTASGLIRGSKPHAKAVLKILGVGADAKAEAQEKDEQECDMHVT